MKNKIHDIIYIFQKINELITINNNYIIFYMIAVFEYHTTKCIKHLSKTRRI